DVLATRLQSPPPPARVLAITRASRSAGQETDSTLGLDAAAEHPTHPVEALKPGPRRQPLVPTVPSGRHRARRGPRGRPAFALAFSLAALLWAASLWGAFDRVTDSVARALPALVRSAVER